MLTENRTSFSISHLIVIFSAQRHEVSSEATSVNAYLDLLEYPGLPTLDKQIQVWCCEARNCCPRDGFHSQLFHRT